MIISRLSSVVGILAPLAMALGGPAPGSAQAGDFLTVRGPDDSSLSLPVRRSRGYATLPHDALRQLGWAIEVDAPRLLAQLGSDGPVVEFSLGSPLFYWDGELLQLVSPPFLGDGSVQIPLQFVVDFLPPRASESYAFLPEERALEILDASLWPQGGTDNRSAQRERRRIPSRSRRADRDDTAGDDRPQGQASTVDPSEDQAASTDNPSTPTLQEDLDAAAAREKRVVVIDPGHGGSDPGATGRGGRREKDIALAIGRYLERELRDDEDIEVYMTRDRDVLVPLWERGPRATLLKGASRFGVFISIHVNSISSPAIRGFETYFLSEARTEHEARVAALENAPLQLAPEPGASDAEDVDRTLIFRDLQNRGYQRWSVTLAEEIQAELEEVHPGPNRGVRQGPFAVITNTLMPAVLVEVGYITNRDEERVLSRVEFQRSVAGALAQAIRDFFERYPPGQGVAAQGPSR